MNRNDELITQWIDGELDGDAEAEFNSLFAADREFAERAKAQAASIGEALRGGLPAELEPPYPEFFNSQIQKHIRDKENAGGQHAESAEPSFSVLSWLKSPFTIAAAAAAVFVLMINRGGEPAGQGAGLPTVVGTYAPDPLVQVVRAEYDEEAEATVIMLTGLARIPDEVEVGGKNIATYTPAGPRGFGRFYTDDAQ